MNTAILFLIFNRPETASQVFEKIRLARPPRLYVACDGPRNNHSTDIEMVRLTRDLVTKVDWPCNIKTLFRDHNLGCKKAVSSAIDWFFEKEEQGIILEDDCVPHLDFFNFCEKLLNYYKNDKRVFTITGVNFQNEKWRGEASYYFSKFNHCWGWATWKRSWSFYQGNISFWPKWKNSSSWIKHTPDRTERKYWRNIFNIVYENKINSWAYPWMASVWHQGGLTVTPNVNLVKNIGFGDGATHTTSKNDSNSNMKINKMSSVLFSNSVEINTEADKWTFDNHYGGKNLRYPYKILSFPYRVLRYIFRFIKKLFTHK